ASPLTCGPVHNGTDTSRPKADTGSMAPTCWARFGDASRTRASTVAGRPKMNHARGEEHCALLLLALLFAGGASTLQAQTQTTAAAQPPVTVDLANLSLEELLNITVT